MNADRCPQCVGRLSIHRSVKQGIVTESSRCHSPGCGYYDVRQFPIEELYES
jgi:hypothetical protein